MDELQAIKEFNDLPDDARTSVIGYEIVCEMRALHAEKDRIKKAYDDQIASVVVRLDKLKTRLYGLDIDPYEDLQETIEEECERTDQKTGFGTAKTDREYSGNWLQ